MNYRLLDAFRGLFEGHPYLHRRSNLGDRVAMEFYEDLYILGRSRKLKRRIDQGVTVLNTQNRRIGVKARRGDGSFGEIVPGDHPIADSGYAVKRGFLATIEIGIEVKILFKAMGKQIDRVENDLRRQIDHFRSKGGKPLSIAIIGINSAEHCTSYERDRMFTTDGKRYKHPRQESAETTARLSAFVNQIFEEALLIGFKASNEPPYDFAWLNENATIMNYAAVLARISRRYEQMS